jgi:ribosomal protein S18 acetylase RimI-like enzyme
MVIRKLTKQDAGAYHALRLEMLREAPSSFVTSLEDVVKLPVESVFASLGLTPPGSGNFMLGAFIEETLIGSTGLSISQRRNEQHRATVVSTYVRRNHAGRGVGTALMRELIAAAQAHPALEHLHLTVTVGNDSAVLLYRKLGFHPCGVEPEAIKIGEVRHDKLHMHLPLLPVTRTGGPRGEAD